MSNVHHAGSLSNVHHADSLCPFLEVEYLYTFPGDDLPWREQEDVSNGLLVQD